MKKISILLSFYNEEVTIEDSIKRICDTLKVINEIDYEIICVNDCSTDNSLNILLNLRNVNKKIKIINLSRRFGHMPGIMAALRNCTGDAAIYLDIDLQDPPNVIKEMILEWLNGKYDVIFTTRINRLGETKLKKIITKIGYKILKKTTYIDMVPDSGDFKLISRKAIDQIAKFNEINPFFRFLVDYVGFKRKQIFYERKARLKGETKFPLGSKVFNQFFEISLIPFSDTPLRLTFLLSLISFMLSIIILIFTSVYSAILGQFNLIYLILIFLTFIVSFSLLSLGFFSLYLAAIFKETKKRPIYIIDNKIGFDTNP